jgi:hypothetical protein
MAIAENQAELQERRNETFGDRRTAIQSAYRPQYGARWKASASMPAHHAAFGRLRGGTGRDLLGTRGAEMD